MTFGDPCDAWDDLTAAQARNPGELLHTALAETADQLEQMTEAHA